VRRLFTFVVGIGLGAAAAILIGRALARARTGIPRAIAEELRSTRSAALAAIEEGRRTMRRKEAQLWAGR
jgi:sensor histidine kinase regulating citrate/malate metabolism